MTMNRGGSDEDEMNYELKDSIRWENRWDSIKQKHYKVLQVLTIVSHLDNETQQGTIDEMWVDVPIVEELER